MRVTERVKVSLALAFAGFFLVLSVVIGMLAVTQFLATLGQLAAAALEGEAPLARLVHVALTGLPGEGSEALIADFIAAINTAIVSVATFELGLGIGKEYTSTAEADILAEFRRIITRFVGVVCIALVLEALIMVIKYSQLELAGNLGYPVAILGGASVLLLALGVFLNLTRPARQDRPRA